MLAVERGETTVAYPTATLWDHHIVNDDIEDLRFVLTFCEKCFSGVAFDRILAGRGLTFEYFGIYRGSSVMKDPGTYPLAFDRRAGAGVRTFEEREDSVVDRSGGRWSYDGTALSGPDAGTSMAFVPSFVTQWYAWADQFPHTDVVHLSGPTGSRA